MASKYFLPIDASVNCTLSNSISLFKLALFNVAKTVKLFTKVFSFTLVQPRLIIPSYSTPEILPTSSSVKIAGVPLLYKEPKTIAEFSSFYSAAGTNDVAWLITPAIDLTSTTGEILSFTTKTRFSNGYPMTAFISTNYDGSTAGISTATWTPLTFATPSANDVVVSSGNIDISAYNSNNVRIAFKYTGSKTGGVTTTCQLDNVKITKN